MEGDNFVYVARTSDVLFVLLTVARRGKKQWEFTEDFAAASKFAGVAQAEALVYQHRCPANMIRLRPYKTAFADWNKAGCPTKPKTK